jgi:hypothetical protein
MDMPIYTSVSSREFTAAMTARWTSLGNISSPRLEALWGVMADTFNAAIDGNAQFTPDTTWRVLEPPTGSGKTQGVCVYAALAMRRNVSAANPLGMLVVTRTIAQADEIVATIRELVADTAPGRVVVAKHSENQTTTVDMRAADVLVITHAAYTRALENIDAGTFGCQLDYTTTTTGSRHLTIIDEALTGIIDERCVTADDVRRVLSYVNPAIRAGHPSQVAALQKVGEVLDKIGTLVGDKTTDTSARVVWRGVADGRVSFPSSMSMGPLRATMASLRYDQLTLHKSSAPDRQRLWSIVEATLKDCEAVLSRWAYYYRKGSADTFNTAELVIPPGLPGVVVLDATARQNFLWRLLERRAVMADIPAGTRSYSNVTLNVARGSGLGKTKMTDRGRVRIPRLLSNLEASLATTSKVLLVCHKSVEHVAKSYAPNFADYAVAHWGAVDGRNDWNDYDTAVIFGLSYRPATWANNAFFALQGLQDNAWLSNPSWGAYTDVRREMQQRQLTVSIVQAVNRVRCRRTVDVDGNCLPTNLYIVLPNDIDGDAVLANLQDEMPGVVVTPWAFEMDGPAERVRRGSSHEALLSMMSNRLPGETSMSAVQSELGLSASAAKDLKAILRNPGHELVKSLATIGVHPRVAGTGRGTKSWLEKFCR